MKYTSPQKRDVSRDPTTITRRQKQDETTANPIQAEAQKVLLALQDGLPKGNAELAAMLGHAGAQSALHRPLSKGMSKEDFINFLLTDPNLKIEISVGR